MRQAVIALLLITACFAASSVWAQDKERDRDDSGRDKNERRERLSSPAGREAASRRAAAEAEQRFGGRALAVVRVGDGHRVRLLLEGGRVTTVTIKD